MARRYNLLIEQGATFQHTINWSDPDGDPINLTGYRIRFQIRQSPASATKLLDFDSNALGSGMHIGDLDATGVISITLDPSVTSALAFTAAEYDITATSGGGAVYRLHEGKAALLLGVTR
jgi:hypothetical protein